MLYTKGDFSMKKKMNRVLSAFLAIIMLMSLFVLPASTAVAAKSNNPTKITGLKITTADKERQLKLSWNKQANVTGYVIYRSATGKDGTFKKIATVKDKRYYVDRNLKDSQTYYYKIRAYLKQTEKNVYGPFAEINLSTRVSAAFVKRKFNATVRFLAGFYEATDFKHSKHLVTKVNTDGDRYDFIISDEYYRFNYKNCKNLNDIRKQLTKYLSKDLANCLIKDRFKMIDGKVYIFFPAMGAESYYALSKTKVPSIKYADKKLTAKILITEGCLDDFYSYNLSVKMLYESGRWVFDSFFIDYLYPYE